MHNSNVVVYMYVLIKWEHLSVYLSIFLRGDRYLLEGAELKGTIRYRHQGGGQAQADHLGVSYDINDNTTTKEN